MEEKKKTFNYTYSASQQEEIKSIREKYAPPTQEEDKMERLRQLDQSVTKPGTIVSLIVGIIGALIMGTGMSCFIPNAVQGYGLIGAAISISYLYASQQKNRKTI